MKKLFSLPLIGLIALLSAGTYASPDNSGNYPAEYQIVINSSGDAVQSYPFPLQIANDRTISLENFQFADLHNLSIENGYLNFSGTNISGYVSYNRLNSKDKTVFTGFLCDYNTDNYLKTSGTSRLCSSGLLPDNRITIKAPVYTLKKRR